MAMRKKRERREDDRWERRKERKGRAYKKKNQARNDDYSNPIPVLGRLA